MASLPTVSLAKDLRASIHRGHPWLFDRALTRRLDGVPPGAEVVVAYQGERLAVGYADPGRPIAVRILERDSRARVDEAWAAERAAAAARCRLANPRLTQTNALRLIHGENDFMPGLVVDLYADTAVAVFDGPAAAAFWAPRMSAVVQGLGRSGVGLARLWARPVKGQPPARAGEHAGALAGDEPPEIIEIHEHGARFEVDVRRGQKTGLFLDQRDNRQLVAILAAGGRVLNLFAYTGGFSVHAGLGGAAHVTSVDIAEPAMAAARRNVARSGLDAGAHRLVTADAFAFLDDALARGERWDLVVVDPPSFAPSERARQKGLQAYRTLNRQALGVVEPGGILCSASCSSHVSTPDLVEVVAAAAEQAGRRVRILDSRGAASDHPVLPAFPEGQYLSFLVIRVE